VKNLEATAEAIAEAVAIANPRKYTSTDPDRDRIQLVHISTNPDLTPDPDLILIPDLVLALQVEADHPDPESVVVNRDRANVAVNHDLANVANLPVEFESVDHVPMFGKTGKFICEHV
jgi:hypothetical protein